MTSHWEKLQRHWSLLGPPLKPPPEAVDAYRDILRPRDAEVVLLGVTPELADLGRTVVALDESEQMIAMVWPGDTASRRAIRGSWFDMPFEDATVGLVAGDGCVSVLDTPATRARFFAEVARVLRPGGRAALRAFASPEAPEPLDAVRVRALGGGVSSFHELKWRVAMARAAGHCGRTIAVRSIREAFEATFPDREELCDATGWDLATVGTIDAYAESPAIYSFPTAQAFAAEARRFFDDVRVLSSGNYPFAEQCPMLVLTGPSG